MKDKSGVLEESLNDEIEKEIQRLRHINQMCRKMSQSARKIGRNYATLIISEKSFNDLLGDLPDLNESLGEELENTSMTQQDLIGVEGGMKGEYKTKHTTQIQYPGADPEGGAPGARPPPPLKLEKI